MNDLINWILEEGRNSDDLGAILKGLSERFVAQGNPLCWTSLTMPTIDPTAAVLRFTWSRDKGLTSAALSPRTATELRINAVQLAIWPSETSSVNVGSSRIQRWCTGS